MTHACLAQVDPLAVPAALRIAAAAAWPAAPTPAPATSRAAADPRSKVNARRPAPLCGSAVCPANAMGPHRAGVPIGPARVAQGSVSAPHRRGRRRLHLAAGRRRRLGRDRASSARGSFVRRRIAAEHRFEDCVEAPRSSIAVHQVSLAAQYSAARSSRASCRSACDETRPVPLATPDPYAAQRGHQGTANAAKIHATQQQRA